MISALKDMLECPNILQILGSKLNISLTKLVFLSEWISHYIVLLNITSYLECKRKNNIFMEDLRVRQRRNLYKLYQAGLLRVKGDDNSSGDESDTSDVLA